MMNEPRPTGRPRQSGTRTAPDGRPVQTDERRRRARARQRARQRRRFQIFVLTFLALVILVSAGVGYLIGYHVSKAKAVPTEPVSDVQTDPVADPVSTDPPAEPEVPADTTAPQIMGVNKLSVFVGSSVAYRSGSLVTAATDPNPTLTVDSQWVNLSAPGCYQLVYHATDSAGNESSVQTTVTVVEAPETYVDEALIKEKADELLAKILTDDMTPEQQVNTIYDWIESHCYYIAHFDKSDYMQAAYLMLTNNRGDCYGFYALSRLLFDRLGLPNLTVTRLPNEVRTTNHWWNMVSLDGGESWYHFDSTPHLTADARTCLVTDAYLEEFNQQNPNYYYYDQASCPRTPAA